MTPLGDDAAIFAALARGAGLSDRALDKHRAPAEVAREWPRLGLSPNFDPPAEAGDLLRVIGCSPGTVTVSGTGTSADGEYALDHWVEGMPGEAFATLRRLP